MGDQSMGTVGGLSADVIMHHVFRILADNNAPNSSPNSANSAITARFNPSMAIIIIVLISAFLFMGFFSIYVRRCTRGSEGPMNDAARLAQREAAAATVRQAQGLDKSVVESLPLVGYSLVKGLEGGKDLSECAVCLSDFEEDDNVRLLPKCGHIFHSDCIDMWFHSHSTCPLCRSSLVPIEGKEVDGDQSSPSEEVQNWITSRGMGPDGEAFTIHEGPPVPPNGSILELLSREGAERILAESVRITGERAERLDAGLARREGEDENVERAAGFRALNRALSKNSASFRNASRGLDASGRIEAINSSSARFNSSSVSISVPDLNETGSKSFGSIKSIDMSLMRSSSVGSSGRYIKQLLGMQGFSNYSPDEFGLDRARLLNSKQELPIVNPTVRRERSASELRNFVIPTWQDIDLNAPSGAGGIGGRGVSCTELPSPTESTDRPGVLPVERWASRSRKFWSGELTAETNFDVKRMELSGEQSGLAQTRRKDTGPIVEERTKSDRWSSIGQSFRRTFSLKRTTSNASDVESSSQQGNSKQVFPQGAQSGGSPTSKPKKFSPWAGAMKIRRQSSNSGDLPSPHSPSSLTFAPSLPVSDFLQSLPVDSPRSLPPDSIDFPHSFPVPNEQQQQQQQRPQLQQEQQQQRRQPSTKEDHIQIDTQP